MTAAIGTPVIVAIVVAAIVGSRLVLYARRGGRAGNVIVRCRRGHLFTTIWVPLASFKAVRLGPFRFQYCPVGKHWSLVSRVDESTLTEEERRAASGTKDVRIP